MSLFDRFRDALKPDHSHQSDGLNEYRRLGNQVYEVEVEIAETKNPRARAILQAAKVLQTLADALIGDAAAANTRLPTMSVHRAESWYGRIPDLLVGARQEAKVPESSQVGLPIRLKDAGTKAIDTWSDEHLLGLRRAATAARDFLQKRIEHAEFQTEAFKDVIVYYQEAKTRQEAGDAIVGLLVQGQTISDASRRDAEAQYMSTVARYLLIAQGLEEPTVLTYEQIEVDFGSQEAAHMHTNDQAMGGTHTMNFEQMQQQSNNIQQHNQTIVNQLQQVVGKVQNLDGNEGHKQDIAYALRELALSVRGLNQETMGLLQNMALYIQHLENSHQNADHYQRQYPPQYQQPYPQQPVLQGGMFGQRSGGGFWDTLIRSAEMGAGFEIGADIVNDIFGGF